MYIPALTVSSVSPSHQPVNFDANADAIFSGHGLSPKWREPALDAILSLPNQQRKDLFCYAEKKGLKADLSGLWLQGKDLSGLNLRGANLSKSCLMEANLKGADLGGANFELANARGASFEDVNLIDAKFESVSLRSAKFDGADLNNARFDSVDITDASFVGAYAVQASFENVQGAVTTRGLLPEGYSNVTTAERDAALASQAARTGQPHAVQQHPLSFESIPSSDVERFRASMRIKLGTLAAVPETPRGTDPSTIDRRDWKIPQRTYQERYDARIRQMKIMLNPNNPDLFKGDVIAGITGDELKGIMAVSISSKDIVLINGMVTHPGPGRVGTELIKQAIQYARDHGKSGKLGLSPLCEDSAEAFKAIGFVQDPALGIMVLDPAQNPQRWN
jgi:uncharacterized protein YjbI with pentapeptide repeats